MKKEKKLQQDFSLPLTYSATSKLRFKGVQIPYNEDGSISKIEYRLQQLHIGSDGSEKWEFIEYVD